VKQDKIKILPKWAFKIDLCFKIISKELNRIVIAESCSDHFGWQVM